MENHETFQAMMFMSLSRYYFFANHNCTQVFRLFFHLMDSLLCLGTFCVDNELYFVFEFFLPAIKIGTFDYNTKIPIVNIL